VINLNTVEPFNVRLKNQYLKRSNDDTLQHKNWNGNATDFKIKNLITFDSEPNQFTQFEYLNEVHFFNDINGINDTSSVKRIKISDPWRVGFRFEQPAEFIEIGQTTKSTSFKGFRNMFPDDEFDYPYYSVRPIEVIPFGEGAAVFKEWVSNSDVQILDDINKSGDKYQKALVITGSNAQVTAKYFYDIVAENAVIYFENDSLRLHASHAIASQDSIYEFVEWRVYQPDGVTEDNSYATLVQPTRYDGGVIEILKDEAVIKPIYRSINQRDHILRLYEEETLALPENADIALHDFFSIQLNGGEILVHNIDGNNAVLQRLGNDDSFEMFWIEPDYYNFTWGAPALIENITFKNFWSDDYIEPVMFCFRWKWTFG